MPQRTPSPEPTPYPRREPYFGNRFLRTLTKCAVAMELGGDACWLLTVVVMQEDACRFRRPVTFWNQRLCDLCGWADDRTLVRTRSMLVGSGWLNYQAAPEGTRKPGAYFVTIPAEAEGMDDPTEEGPRPTPDDGRDGGRDGGRSVGRSVGRYGGRDGGLFVPVPTPIPGPGSGVAAVAGGKAATTTAAALTRVDVIDKTEAAQALADGGLYRLLKAMRCTVDKATKPEWPRADVTGGLVLHTVAAVLYWRICQRDPVRMPSGFEKARKLFNDQPEVERREIIKDACEYIGITCPTMKGQA
jgi:hypothetical protein